MVLGPRQRVVLAWLPAVAYTLLIWWLSSQSLHVDFLGRVPFQDKGVHFLEFGALGFFLAHAVTTTWAPGALPHYVLAVLMTCTLGSLDELHQGFVPGRFSDALDLLADSVGALTAVVLYAGLVQLFRAVRHSRQTRLAESAETPGAPSSLDSSE